MSDTRLLVGAAQADITPPLGLEMCGYGPYEKRLGTAVLDPLHARAMWLTSDEVHLVLISVDVCAVTGAMRDAVGQALAARLGMHPDALVLAASHTHSGPATLPLIGWGRPDSAYIDALTRQLVGVAVAAHDAREPAKIGFGHVRIEGVGVNREHPQFGPTDPAAQLLRVDRMDGTPMVLGYNYAAHPVTRYPFTHRLSADWPGQVCATLQTAFDGATPVFLLGCAGNINGHHVMFGRTDPDRMHGVSDAQCGEVARRVIDRIVPAFRTITTDDPAPLHIASADVSLPCGAIDVERHRRLIDEHTAVAERLDYDDLQPLHDRLESETEEERLWRLARWQVDASTRQLEIHDAGIDRVDARIDVIRIGEAVLVAWPAEVFVELGIELRERSEARMTLPVGYANGCIGYLPTPWAYESQGRPHAFGYYPAVRTPEVWGMPPFAANAPRVLVERTLELVRAVVDAGVTC